MIIIIIIIYNLSKSLIFFHVIEHRMINKSFIRSGKRQLRSYLRGCRSLSWWIEENHEKPKRQ